MLNREKLLMISRELKEEAFVKGIRLAENIRLKVLFTRLMI